MERVDWVELAHKNEDKIKEKIKEAINLSLENYKDLDTFFVLLGRDGKVWIEKINPHNESDTIIANKWDFIHGEYSWQYGGEEEVTALILYLQETFTLQWYFNNIVGEIRRSLF